MPDIKIKTKTIFLIKPIVIFLTRSVASETPKSAETVEITTGNQKPSDEIIEVVKTVEP